MSGVEVEPVGGLSPQIKDFPIRMEDHEVASFGKHFVVRNLRNGAYLFIDEEEKTLVDALAQPRTLSELTRVYRDAYRVYSFRKVFGLVGRLLEHYLLEPSTRDALLKESVFAVYAPRPWRKPAVSLPLRSSAAPARAMAALTTTPGLIFLAFAGLVALLLFLGSSDRLALLRIQGALSLGLVTWYVSVAFIISLKRFLQLVTLNAWGAPVWRSGLFIRHGLLCFSCDTSGVLAKGREATTRFHLASLLAPGLLALPAALLWRSGIASNAASIWGVACFFVVFIDLCPFISGELVVGLNRLSGRSELRARLKAFVSRRLIRRMFETRRGFEFELYFILYGVFVMVWAILGYRFVTGAFELYLRSLVDAIVISPSWLEKASAVVYLGRHLSAVADPPVRCGAGSGGERQIHGGEAVGRVSAAIWAPRLFRRPDVRGSRTCSRAGSTDGWFVGRGLRLAGRLGRG